MVLAIFIMFQTILVCTNIFYFSKDIELILPFPIKPVNLLIAKFNTLICTLYVSEAIFGIIPICIYGILTHSTLLFYIYAVLIFIFFPVFLAAPLHQFRLSAIMDQNAIPLFLFRFYWRVL